MRRLRKGVELYRAHHRDFGVWWFASDTGGRFNLEATNGTCYLAVDEETALRERLGPTTGVVSHG
ncbi:MAG: RES domain-containing protein [Nocardiaceae bacterium]|nr:RES domain-containing protein [Nocardiaceae bacterium]